MGSTADDETKKRLQTTLEGFSEVTAISQRAINGAMQNLIKQYPETGHVKVTTKRGDSIDAMIRKPSVVLKVTGMNREQLDYACGFSSGTLTFAYYPDPVVYDVKEWTIAFSVDIGMEDIETGTDEDKRVRSVINQPGDFSIRSLFLMFNQADIIKMDLTHCNFGEDHLDQDDISALGGVLADWYVGDNSVMNDRRKRTIGYSLYTTKPDSVNQQAPTFPPTSLRFQTYSYIAPGATKPEEGVDVGDNNMLLYLQMTGHQDFPSDEPLRYTGNFVTNGMDGTMCISRKIFWDDYLLRKSTPQLLQSLNPTTYAWITDTNMENDFRTTFKIGLGNPYHDDVFFSWRVLSPSEWSWKPDEPEQRFKGSHKSGGGETHMTITCTTANILTAQPGSNEIRIEGKTEIKAEARGVSTITSFVWDWNYEIDFSVDWAILATLNAVDNGGIQISLNLPENPTDIFRLDSKILNNDFNIPNYDTSHIVDDQRKQVIDSLQKQLNNFPLPSIAAKIQENLNGAVRFVVPGEGDFSYKNPTFNDNLDLMVEVSYQGK